MNETRPLIYGKISDCMKQIGAIGKDSKNTQQGFMYRGVDAVMNALNPVLTENRIFCVPEVLEQHREERQTRNGGNLIYSILKMRYTLYAEDGSSVSADVIGEGMDSADKGSNKAMSVAYKYAMFQIFSIPTEEMRDPDAETPPESTRKPVQAKNIQQPDPPAAKPPAAEWSAKTEINIFCQQHHMTMEAFAKCRTAVIASGIVPGIPANELTKEQCKALLEAIRVNCCKESA